MVRPTISGARTRRRIWTITAWVDGARGDAPERTVVLTALNGEHGDVVAIAAPSLAGAEVRRLQEGSDRLG